MTNISEKYQCPLCGTKHEELINAEECLEDCLINENDWEVETIYYCEICGDYESTIKKDVIEHIKYVHNDTDDDDNNALEEARQHPAQTKIDEFENDRL